ncbi:MAG: PadR family transcriptional regulator [Oceanococcaceae bacterium]
MALAHAILVTLLDKPQSGYELGKRFDKTVGVFWRARHQQIYSELHRLADKGWVTGRTVTQHDRPNRIEYTITDRGRAAVQAWAAETVEPPSVKEELVVKLFALGTVPSAVIREQLRQRRALHQRNLGEYAQVMARYYPDPARLSGPALGRYLGLRCGIRSEQTGVDWCDEALAALAEAS